MVPRDVSDSELSGHLSRRAESGNPSRSATLIATIRALPSEPPARADRFAWPYAVLVVAIAALALTTLPGVLNRPAPSASGLVVATSTPPSSADPSTAASPTSTSDAARVIECSDYPEGAETWTGHALIYDETGVVVSCQMSRPQFPTAAVTVWNLSDDLRTLRVTWIAGPCAGYEFRFTAAPDAYNLDFTPASCGFASLVSHEFLVRLRRDIDAQTIVVTWRGQQ